MATDISPNKRLLALTREMFEKATAGDWDQLTQLEQSRLPLLNKIFSKGIAGNVELAKDVLAIDEKTKKLAEAQMPVLQQEILKFQKSGQAKNAYQTIQDSVSESD